MRQVMAHESSGHKRNQVHIIWCSNFACAQQKLVKGRVGVMRRHTHMKELQTYCACRATSKNRITAHSWCMQHTRSTAAWKTDAMEGTQGKKPYVKKRRTIRTMRSHLEAQPL